MSGGGGARTARPRRGCASSCVGRVAQVGLEDDARPTGPSANSSSPSSVEHQLEDGLARVERLHVDVQVRVRARAARRSSARRRPAASRWPRSGASGRSSGVSAETLTERLARGSGPAESRSSMRPRRARRRAPAASSRSASRAALPRSGRPRPAVTVASPSRSTDVPTPPLPQRAQHAQGAAWGSRPR